MPTDRDWNLGTGKADGAGEACQVGPAYRFCGVAFDGEAIKVAFGLVDLVIFLLGVWWCSSLRLTMTQRGDVGGRSDSDQADSETTASRSYNCMIESAGQEQYKAKYAWGL